MTSTGGDGGVRTKIASTMLLALAAVFAGCSLVVSTSDLTGGVACAGAACGSDASSDATGADACAANVQTDSDNCGACGNRCGAGKMCSAGKCVAGCPGGILYVAGDNGGADTNDGCSESTPKKTIASALAAARATKAASSEVHVCGGTYNEDALLIDFPVNLLGGYDCSAWVRTTTYGYPKFEPLNRTVIQADANNQSGSTLSISGLGTSGTATVDGFTILGPSLTLANSSSSALYIYGGGLPVISNCDLEGASSVNAVSIGIYVSFGSDPEITSNLINGGGGTGSGYGILVDGNGVARIHGNTISGGKSTSAKVAGIEIQGCTGFVGDHAIADNTISGGQSSVTGGGYTTLGLTVNDSIAEVRNNVIDGGQATCTSGLCQAVGLYLYDSKSFATVVGNRIEGGTSSGGDSQDVAGVILTSGAQGLLINNAIHALALQSTETAEAINIVQSPSVVTEQNTLYGSSSAYRIRDSSNLVGKNNLLLGESSVGSVGVFFDGCTDQGTPTASSFVDNAFVGFGTSIIRVDGLTGTTCNTQMLTTVAAFESDSSGAASGNRRVVDGCTGEDASRCYLQPACPAAATSSGSCIRTLIGSWDDDSQGGVDLLDDTRTWKLATNAPCLITQGGGNFLDGADGGGGDGGVSDTELDLTGAMRTTPISLGAYESDLGCAQ